MKSFEELILFYFHKYNSSISERCVAIRCLDFSDRNKLKKAQNKLFVVSLVVTVYSTFFCNIYFQKPSPS